MTFVFLFFAAALGSALNSVAGGGAFVAFPSLLWAGLPPVAANATTTLAMWPGLVSSAVAYRREVAKVGRWLPILCTVSVVGGWFGATVLVRTSDTSFMRLLPWLLLLAAATFTWGGNLTRRLIGHEPRPFWMIVLLQIVISIYGGYFGGGMGIMMLAGFSLVGMTDIHEMNGLKVALAIAVNGAALIEFIIERALYWQPGLVMVAGAIVGGYLGASLARRTDRKWARLFVMVIGWTMTVYFFVKG